MSRPLYIEHTERKVAGARTNIGKLQRRPLTGEWIPLYTQEDYDALPEEDQPEFWSLLLADAEWMHAGGIYEDHAYRRHMDGSLETMGHLSPGISGEVAYVLLGVDPLTEPDFFPTSYASYLTDIVVDDSFTIARVEMSPVTGEVIITYPADI